MIEAHKAYRMASMTQNARSWITTAETAMWSSVTCGESHLDLTLIRKQGLFPLNEKDYESLLDWFQLFDYEVDRKRKWVLIPQKDEDE